MHFFVVLNYAFCRRVFHNCCYYIFRVDNADEEFGPDPPPMPETPKKGKKRKAGKEPVEKKEKKQKKEKKKKKGKVDEALVNGNVQLVREIQEVNNFHVVKESKKKMFEVLLRGRMQPESTC